MKTSRQFAITLVVILIAIGCTARATDNPGATKNSASETSSTRTAADVAQPAAPSSPSSTLARAESNAPAHRDSSAISSVDWPQWRGRSRDGNVIGVQPPKDWPKDLKEEWKVTVGVGHASPVIGDGKLFVFAREGEDEVLQAIDPSNGKVLWKNANPIAYEMHQAARAHGKGPKSTPIVHAGKVFTLGISGVLSAHDTKTGKLVWRKEFSKQFQKTSPLFGTAMSPIIEKNNLIAHVGGHDGGALTAFDASTGRVVWSYAADGPAYASPIIVNLGGVRQLVTFTQKELVGLNVATGELLWKLPSKTQYDENCNSPMAYKDTIIFSREEQGLQAVRPVQQGGKWTAQEVWRNPAVELYMNSPVLHGDLLFGLSAKKKGQLFAVNAIDGKTVWEGPGRAGENAAILNLAGTLLVLTNEAQLIIHPATDKGYAPATQYTVATSPTWAHPLMLKDRILIKDETTLRSLAL